MSLSAFPYVGGKTILAEWIIDQLPSHTVYVEPFGGSASVLLNKPRSNVEVYNDLDGDVVQFFEVARERPDELELFDDPDSTDPILDEIEDAGPLLYQLYWAIEDLERSKGGER